MADTGCAAEKSFIFSLKLSLLGSLPTTPDTAEADEVDEAESAELWPPPSVKLGFDLFMPSLILLLFKISW